MMTDLKLSCFTLFSVLPGSVEMLLWWSFKFCNSSEECEFLIPLVHEAQTLIKKRNSYSWKESGAIFVTQGVFAACNLLICAICKMCWTISKLCVCNLQIFDLNLTLTLTPKAQT